MGLSIPVIHLVEAVSPQINLRPDFKCGNGDIEFLTDFWFGVKILAKFSDGVDPLEE